jgi:hypothetical protein
MQDVQHIHKVGWSALPVLRIAIEDKTTTNEVQEQV